MKLLVVISSIVVAMWVSLPAAADNGRDQPRRSERLQQERNAQAERPAPPRQRDADRAVPPNPQGARLSPEERRQLRRDIGDHGREIYRERRR